MARVLLCILPMDAKPCNCVSVRLCELAEYSLEPEVDIAMFGPMHGCKRLGLELGRADPIEAEYTILSESIPRPWLDEGDT